MKSILIIYPAVLMMVLTLILYIKSYFDNTTAYKNKTVKGEYFKAYQGKVPEHIEVSRETLKNQFELPVLFYFLIALILIFDNLNTLDLILAWLFVISRYIHCYIRLTTNYVPFRAQIFQLGLFLLIAEWINLLADIL